MSASITSRILGAIAALALSALTLVAPAYASVAHVAAPSIVLAVK